MEILDENTFPNIYAKKRTHIQNRKKKNLCKIFKKKIILAMRFPTFVLYYHRRFMGYMYPDNSVIIFLI